MFKPPTARMSTGGKAPSMKKQRKKRSDALFNVDAILDYRMNNNVSELLVKWEGYADSFNTWEPYVNLTNNTIAIRYILDNDLIMTHNSIDVRIDDEVIMEIN